MDLVSVIATGVRIRRRMSCLSQSARLDHEIAALKDLDVDIRASTADLRDPDHAEAFKEHSKKYVATFRPCPLLNTLRYPPYPRPSHHDESLD